MGHRLSRIYTRTGDDGTNGLGDGVPDLPPAVTACLTDVQHELFDLGGELCLPGHRSITDAHVTRLEQSLDAFNEPLPPLKDFILPGGGPAAAACHLARTITRRAERRVWALARAETSATEGARYLNRLSDLLFVVARVLARHENGQEVLWRHERERGSRR
jgi:cob(I)alamin adenosyltransferase